MGAMPSAKYKRSDVRECARARGKSEGKSVTETPPPVVFRSGGAKG
jgi:hypothetical protein